MADVSAQFEKISDKAKTATDKIKSASQSTREKLDADVARARVKASEAADQFKDKAHTAREKTSSRWQEMRGKWQAHVAKVRADAKKKKHQLDVHEAARDANEAEACGTYPKHICANQATEDPASSTGPLQAGQSGCRK
jgi:hypothetical protein